jgi:hypothetical protein
MQMPVEWSGPPVADAAHPRRSRTETATQVIHLLKEAATLIALIAPLVISRL